MWISVSPRNQTRSSTGEKTSERNRTSPAPPGANIAQMTRSAMSHMVTPPSVPSPFGCGEPSMVTGHYLQRPVRPANPPNGRGFPEISPADTRPDLRENEISLRTTFLSRLERYSVLYRSGAVRWNAIPFRTAREPSAGTLFRFVPPFWSLIRVTKRNNVPDPCSEAVPNQMPFGTHAPKRYETKYCSRPFSSCCRAFRAPKPDFRPWATHRRRCVQRHRAAQLQTM